ncbi:MAG: NACHT domain-containing protein [Cyanobacteria bacterium P01_H01_bin.21]
MPIPDSIIEKVIDAVLETSGIKEKVGRNECVIRLLQHFELDDIESLTKFEDVYAYALVQYAFDDIGQCKPRQLIEFFKAKEVREVFQAAYRQNDPGGWLRKGEEIAHFRLGNKLLDLNPRRELAIFAGVFMELVRQTSSVKEIRAEQKQQTRFNRLQKQLQDIQTQIQHLPSLDAINHKVNQLAGTEVLALPEVAQMSNAIDLAHQLGEWFEVLDYDRDPDYEVWNTNYFEWIIDFPLTRRKVSRTLVRGVAGEVGISDLQDFQKRIETTGVNEGWLVGNRRVSKAARKAVEDEASYEDISCYTFDELLDEDADFSKYLKWLEEDIKSRKVDMDYLPLACRKDELDSLTHRKIGVSVYEKEDGWIDGYVDQWLDDPAKEHLSILGEFGTGKTWFTLHYAWVALQRYQDAKKRGLERPRVPIVVPLRDYAKSVTVESLFSEFFFRKHEILKKYSVFDRLNRMGKLLLIFDGFDEMAARVDRQAMIDNFWELAKVVTPGAKVILTCRTEHFPDAMEGRKLLGAELKASLTHKTGEPPQFEVLELEKFSDEQVEQLLGRKAQIETVQKIMKNQQLLDLTRRPVMLDLVLEAMPELEAGKPVDMARVYLYAVKNKMERDITSQRTFTSLADKLYFLCELSWEMLSTEQMSLNYRVFPARLRRMFADRVTEDKDLDHWRYDMTGQTILIRNAEGDYSPAHRSLLEFFVAYKIVASLGTMAIDFIEVAQQQSHLDVYLSPQEHTWESYFKRECDEQGALIKISPLKQFKGHATVELLPLLGQTKLTKAVLDLAHPMLDEGMMRDRLLPLLQSTQKTILPDLGYFGGNLAQLMLAKSPYALRNTNLSNTRLREVDFTNAYLQQTNFQGAHLEASSFTKALGCVNSIAFDATDKYLVVGDSKGSLQLWHIDTEQVLWISSDHADWVRSIALSPDGTMLASGSDDGTIKLCFLQTGQCLCTLKGHTGRVRTVALSPDGTMLASGSHDRTIKLWSLDRKKCLHTLEDHTHWVESVIFSPDGNILASGSTDGSIKLWSVDTGKCLQTFKDDPDEILSITFNSDGTMLASGSTGGSIKLWSTETGKCLRTLEGHLNSIWHIAFSADNNILASASDDQMVKLWSLTTDQCLRTLKGHSDGVRVVAFSSDNNTLASGSRDRSVRLWSIDTGVCFGVLKGYSNEILSITFSPHGDTLAFAGDSQTIRLLQPFVSSDYSLTLEGHSNKIRSVSFSPDGTIIASGCDDQTVKVWSVDTGICLHTLEGHSRGVKSVSFSPDGTIIASGSDDQTIKVWSVDTGACLQTLEGHSKGIRSVSFSPDGTIIASGSNDQTVKVWSVDTGVCLQTLEGHSNEIMSIFFHPSSTVLASGSTDKTVKLWSLRTNKCLQTFEGHSEGIWSVAFSPDGNILASGSSDRTVKLWSLDTGRCLQTLKDNSSWVRSVAFSPDGFIIAFTSANETIQIRSVEDGEYLQIIDERPYSGMDITKVTGLTEGQRTALKLMGAIDCIDEKKLPYG